MRFLKKFATHAEYEAYMSGSSVAYPNISLCEEDCDVHVTDMGEVVDPDKYMKQYLTFIALADGTFKFSGITTANTLSYSLNSGETWIELAHDTYTPTVSSGNSIMWKGTCTPLSASSTSYGIGKFLSTNNFDIEGNVMSLLYGDNYKFQTNLSGKDCAFSYLFSANTNVINTQNTSLPATVLSFNCYTSMFRGCSNLVTVPDLPATDLSGGKGCYGAMFNGCTSLTGVPSDYLPATTLSDNCYDSMFYNCSNLVTVPDLPATDLSGGKSCYGAMFYNCTSLIGVPSDYLPATTLSDNCYEYMFAGCTNLTSAPLSIGTSATTMGYQSCMHMFYNCTSLTTAPALPATTLANSAYCYMFRSCTSLTTLPELPATTLAPSCYCCMFLGCQRLTTAPELPATTLAPYCYWSMFQDCTLLTSVPGLPATTLVQGCYNGMFRGCTSLTSVPTNYLPVTTLASYCYWRMFYGCTSLTTAPDLPALTLTEQCYYGIFQGCKKLNHIKCLATNISASSCTTNWVSNVASSGTFIKNPSMSSWTTGVNGIPSNWTVEDAT